MKKSTLTLVFTTVIFFGFTMNLFAQRCFGQQQSFKDELNLTEDQEKQINNLRYENQKKVLDLRNEIEKNRLEIKNMLENNSIDESRIKSLTKKNSELHSQIKQMRVDEWFSVYKLLDESQKIMWTEKFDGIGDNRIQRENRREHKKDRDCFPNYDRKMRNHEFRRGF